MMKYLRAEYGRDVADRALRRTIREELKATRPLVYDLIPIFVKISCG